MKKIILLCCLISLFSCKNKQQTQKNTFPFALHFLDDYTIPAQVFLDSTEIGGLSGIDFNGENYLLVSDQKKKYRFYKASIKIQENKIDTVVFNKVILLQTADNSFFKNNYLDLEGIRFLPNKKSILISSEGSISSAKDPSLFSITESGTFLDAFPIKDYFKANSKAQPRNNGLFEGLSISADKKAFWVAAELPLTIDGPEPTLHKTISPARITRYDLETKKPTKQVTYLLDSITKTPKGSFYVNGISEILILAPEKLFVIERAYSSGLGTHGNSVRLYLADLSKATNTLNIESLKSNKTQIVPAEKRLLFDFSTVENKLKSGYIDNIEGITFGPILPNGHQSILLVSDNNFNSMGEQVNQVILMELIPSSSKK